MDSHIPRTSPAPWTVKHSSGAGDSHLAWIEAADGVSVAFCHYCNDCNSEKNHNDKYILAAAPDLLAALEEAVAQQGGEHASDCHFLYGTGRPCDCWVPDARAALAPVPAKGGT